MWVDAAVAVDTHLDAGRAQKKRQKITTEIFELVFFWFEIVSSEKVLKALQLRLSRTY